jgi:hypothetical protein
MLLAIIVDEQLGVIVPAVQVYKNNGIMIPVDQAKQCKAYVCPWTKKLFATKRSYVSHLNQLRASRMHYRARQMRFRRKLEDMWNQPDFDSVIRWIHNNPEVFWENCKRQAFDEYTTKRWDAIRDTFEIKITNLNLTYSDSVSNSHNCPHTGVTNWGGHRKLKDGTNAPRGYPGFAGNISFHTPVNPVSFASNVFKGIRIHTGSGGGGDGHYQYSVSFFLDDWPGIAKTLSNNREHYEKENLINMIKNEYKPFHIANFVYGQCRRP